MEMNILKKKTLHFLVKCNRVREQTDEPGETERLKSQLKGSDSKTETYTRHQFILELREPAL